MSAIVLYADTDDVRDVGFKSVLNVSFPVSAGLQIGDVAILQIQQRSDTPGHTLSDTSWEFVQSIAQTVETSPDWHTIQYKKVLLTEADLTLAQTVTLNSASPGNGAYLWAIRGSNAETIASTTQFNVDQLELVAPSVNAKAGSTLVAVWTGPVNTPIVPDPTEGMTQVIQEWPSTTHFFTLATQDIAVDGPTGTRRAQRQFGSGNIRGTSILFYLEAPLQIDPIAQSYEESAVSMLEQDSLLPADVAASFTLAPGAPELNTDDEIALKGFYENINIGLVFPRPTRTYGLKRKYYGVTRVTFMRETIAPAIMITAQDAVAKNTMTLQDVGQYISALFATAHSWFSWSGTFPDVRYPDGSTGEMEYLTLAQEQGAKRTIWEVYEQIFAGTNLKIRQTSEGVIEFVPEYGPDAPSASVATISSNDILENGITDGRPTFGSRVVKATVSNQGYEFVEDVLDPLQPAWAAIRSGAYANGVGEDSEWIQPPGDRLIISRAIDGYTPLELGFWPLGDGVVLQPGNAIDIFSGGPLIVGYIKFSRPAVNDFFSATPTLSNFQALPLDGLWYDIFRAEYNPGGPANDQFHIVVRARYDAAARGVFLETRDFNFFSQQYNAGAFQYSDGSHCMFAFDLNSESSVWQRAQERVSGSFGKGLGDTLIAADQGLISLNNEEGQEIEISIDLVKLSPSQLRSIAQAIVESRYEEIILYEIKQSPHNRYAIKPDHMFRLATLRDVGEVRVLRRGESKSFAPDGMITESVIEVGLRVSELSQGSSSVVTVGGQPITIGGQPLTVG